MDKKIFLLFLVCILMIGTVKADFTFDNTKSFDATKGQFGTIVIKNMFGFGSTLAEYQLTDTSKYCFIHCYAEGTVILNTPAKLFESIEFNRLNTQSKTNLDYKILISNSQKDVEVITPVYVNECKDRITANGTAYDCKQVLKDEVKSTIKEDVWEIYDGKELTGTYKWKIEAVKKPFQNLDWIAVLDKNILGNFKTDEWAVWTSGFNVDLREYYNFSSTFPAIQPYVNNLTLSATYLETGNTTCFLGNDCIFGAGQLNSWATVGDTGVDSIFNLSNNAFYQQYTYNGWIKLIGGDYYFWMSKGNTASGWDFGDFVPGSRIDYSPAGDFSATYTRDDKWRMFTFTLNSTDACWFINGTRINCRGSSMYDDDGMENQFAFLGSEAQGGQWTNGYMDEWGFWNRTLSDTEISDLYNNGVGLTWTSGAITSAITVNLATYPNSINYNSTIFTEYFNSTALFTAGNFTNGTLYIWNSTDIYKTNYSAISDMPNGTGLNLSLTGFEDGGYEWNVYYCGLNSTGDTLCNFAGLNNTFTVDTFPPIPTIIYPFNTTAIRNTTDIMLNFSIAHLGLLPLSSCWYSIDGGSNNFSLYSICNGNTTIDNNYTYFTASNGNKRYYIDFYSNDSVNNIGQTQSTFYVYNYTHSINKLTSVEGDQVIFKLNISGNGIVPEYSSTNATLKIANVDYTPDSSDMTNPNIMIFTKTVTMPIGSGNITGNITYYNWTYNLQNATTLTETATTDTKDFSIYSMTITNCSDGGRIIVNMTIRDEEFMSFLNLTNTNTDRIEIDLNISSRTNQSISWNFSHQWDDVNSSAVCIPNGILNGSTYRIDFIVGYEGTDHVREFFYMDNGTLDNSHYFNSYTDDEIDLLDLLTTDSTTFLFEYTDADGLTVDDIIVHTFRKYIGEGVHREVERSRQDTAGQTHVHLVEEDVIYYFMITQYGNILFTSDTYNAKCLSTPCEISLTASPISPNWSIIDSEGGHYLVSSNQATRIVTTSFTIDSSDLVNMSLYEMINGNATLLNTTSLTAMSGSLSLTVPLAYGNNTFFVAIYRANEFVKSEWVDLTESGQDYFGTMGVLLGGIIVLTIMLMAVTEGAGFIIFTALALIIIGVMKLVDLGWVALISIICAGGVIIFKLIDRRGTKQ